MKKTPMPFLSLRIILCTALSAACLSSTAQAQGSLTPPGPPAPSMYSLEDIYESAVSLTNALMGMNWADVRQIQADVSAITNTLWALQDLDRVAGTMEDWTNSTADLARSLVAVSNACQEVEQQMREIGGAISNIASTAVAFTNLLHQQQTDLDSIKAIEEENNALLRSITSRPAGWQ